MVGITRQDRIQDICARSGQSEHIVRRVLEAETESVIQSLKRGERVNMMGRCTMEPTLKTRLETVSTMAPGEAPKQRVVPAGVNVKVKPSQALLAKLEDIAQFEHSEYANQYDEDEVQIPQISALE